MLAHKSLECCLFLPILLQLLLDLPPLLAESGSDDGDEELDLPKIHCFSSFTANSRDDRITCKLTEPVTDSESLKITFREEEVTMSCEIKPRQSQSCSVGTSKFALFNHCCIHVSRAGSREMGPCDLKKKIIHMVKPGTPFGVAVTTLLEAKEIKLTWDTPSIRLIELKNNLLHQVSYRSTDSDWEQLNVTAHSVRLLMKNLIPNSQYMIRVRSTPDQKYFKGIWSDWSQTVNFKTPPAVYTFSTGVKLTISFMILLILLLIGLSALLWENRIKPHIWPKIPNPKYALEQLYMKPNKAVEVSFNPYSFLDVLESRVDTIQVRGAQLCHCYPSPVNEAAVCNSVTTEKELLILGDPFEEKGAWSIGTNTQHCAEEPPEPSAPPLCLSPGVQPHGSVETSCHLLGSLTGDSSDGGAPCVKESNGDRSTEGSGAGGARGRNLGLTIAGSPVAPPDESYITMSNLYKIQ
ncbi:interleukin-7 receptor subunit alpha [Heterodontus francisci]|uniref:interleukin-7 receptor subunit alpha n=1 Tax=Heterodontus francisci TaxID=7792 RepID=UPI00355BAF4E